MTVSETAINEIYDGKVTYRFRSNSTCNTVWYSQGAVKEGLE